MIFISDEAEKFGGNYLRQQQQFRWESKTMHDNWAKKISFYNGPASGVQRYLNFTTAPKRHDVKTLEKLLSEISSVEADITGRIQSYSKKRKMLADNSPTGIKKGCRGEHNFLSSLIKESEEFLTEVKGIVSELNTVAIQFKRSKVESETAKDLSSRKKRRIKENKRKLRNQNKQRLDKTITEILEIFCGKEKTAELIAKIQEKGFVPLDPKLSIYDVPADQTVLQSLRPKFHLNALQFLIKRKVFSGNLLEYVTEKIEVWNSKATNDKSSPVPKKKIKPQKQSSIDQFCTKNT